MYRRSKQPTLVSLHHRKSAIAEPHQSCLSNPALGSHELSKPISMIKQRNQYSHPELPLAQNPLRKTLWTQPPMPNVTLKISAQLAKQMTRRQQLTATQPSLSSDSSLSSNSPDSSDSSLSPDPSDPSDSSESSDSSSEYTPWSLPSPSSSS
jgi:hypothetical protein